MDAWGDYVRLQMASCGSFHAGIVSAKIYVWMDAWARDWLTRSVLNLQRRSGAQECTSERVCAWESSRSVGCAHHRRGRASKWGWAHLEAVRTAWMTNSLRAQLCAGATVCSPSYVLHNFGFAGLDAWVPICVLNYTDARLCGGANLCEAWCTRVCGIQFV